MATSRCPNCGEKLLEFYSRSGAKVFICPKVKLSEMTHNLPICAFLLCDGDILKDDEALRNDVLHNVSQIVKITDRIKKKLIA